MRYVAFALLVGVASCGFDQVFGGSGGGSTPVAGAPAALQFVDQPQTTPARNPLPPVRITVRDDQGNVATNFSGLVALAIATDPAGGTLGDTTGVAAVRGIATFRHLRIDKAGRGYTLVASAPATPLAPVISQPFDILAPPTGSLTVTTATTGSAPASGYTVSVDDTINQAIAINGAVTLIGVAAGPHTVALSGVTADCTVSGANPQTVTVTGGETAQASYAISCTPPPGRPPRPPPRPRQTPAPARSPSRRAPPGRICRAAMA